MTDPYEKFACDYDEFGDISDDLALRLYSIAKNLPVL